MNHKYILCKNPVQLDTLAIVQYIHKTTGVFWAPSLIYERQHPVPSGTALPCIIETTIDGDVLHAGFDACVRFYERGSGIDDIVAKAEAFKLDHPNYCIHA